MDVFLQWVACGKIVFSHPKNGNLFQSRRARKLLKVGKIYTIDYLVVQPFETTIYLVEVPEIGFNSVFFEPKAR